jgi:hypothetical protein
VRQTFLCHLHFLPSVKKGFRAIQGCTTVTACSASFHCLQELDWAGLYCPLRAAATEAARPLWPVSYAVPGCCARSARASVPRLLRGAWRHGAALLLPMLLLSMMSMDRQLQDSCHSKCDHHLVSFPSFDPITQKPGKAADVVWHGDARDACCGIAATSLPQLWYVWHSASCVIRCIVSAQTRCWTAVCQATCNALDHSSPVTTVSEAAGVGCLAHGCPAAGVCTGNAPGHAACRTLPLSQLNC